MKLLIVAQKVDKRDDVLGFFHGWVSHIADNVSSVDVIALSVGEHILPRHVRLFSLLKDKGVPKFFQAVRFYFFLFKTLPFVDGVFVHMAPEYVKAMYPINFFFRRPVVMWYAHIRVSPTAKWALDKVDKILTPSKDSFALDSDKVVSTGHGIDTSIFKPSDSRQKDPPIILTQSRISRVKRLETLIEAIRILKDIYQGKFLCKIIGAPIFPDDEAYLKELKGKISEYNLDSYFEWVGSVPNIHMPSYYTEASVFVRLQGGGGFGKTELESMACGVPAIIPTAVYNVILGVFSKDLYFTEDDASQCAQNIKKVLLWDDNTRRSYAEKARDIVVNNHNIAKLAKKIVESFPTQVR